jgi:hypothetical protein
MPEDGEDIGGVEPVVVDGDGVLQIMDLVVPALKKKIK